MANKTLFAQIKQRSDTAANWTAKDPVISDGELIVVTTNAGEKRFKVGDGEKTFTQLPYADENILSKIKTYTAGDGISISDTGVISSTGGGSGSDVFVIEMDESGDNIITPFDDIKNAIQNHRCLMVIINTRMVLTVYAYYISDNQSEAIVLVLYGLGGYIRHILSRVSGSTTIQQSCEQFNVPSASYDKPLTSGAAYWNASNNKWEIKDITSGGDALNPIVLTTNDAFHTTSDVCSITSPTATEIWDAFNRNDSAFYLRETGPHGALQPLLVDGPSGTQGGGNEITFKELHVLGTLIQMRKFLWRSIDNTLTLQTITEFQPYKAGNGISISYDGTISVTAAKIYSGTSDAPSADLGENGDIYIQTEG